MKAKIIIILVIKFIIPSILFPQESTENNYNKIMLGEENIKNWSQELQDVWKTSLKYQPIYVLSDNEFLGKYDYLDPKDQTWYWKNDSLYLINTAGNPDSINMKVTAVRDVGGWSVTSGDFNGDGIQDIVTLSGKSDSNCYIYYGKSDFSVIPDDTLKTDEILSQVSFVGDINGDGYGELTVATKWGINKVYLYYGSANGIISSSKIELSHEYYGFGHLISKHAGDINNDGFDDVLIGGTKPPYFCLYYGNSKGIKSNPDHIIEFPNYHVGVLPISFIGDINNDLFDDIAVPLTPSDYNNISSVHIYYGSAIGLDTTNKQLLEIDVGEERTHSHVFSVSSINDVNNDNINDLILGDQFADGLYENEGKILVFYGSSDGANEIPDKIINNPIPEYNVRFGSTLDGVGDINSDGIDDIIVGSPYANKVFIFYGSQNGISDSSLTTLTDLKYNTFGWSVSAVGNIMDDYRNFFIVGEEFGTSFLFSFNGGSVSTKNHNNNITPIPILYQNYPNPFNPSTTIQFYLPKTNSINIAVYNTIGQKLEDVFDGTMKSGYHKLEFDGTGYSSGIYFYSMITNNTEVVKKMLILK